MKWRIINKDIFDGEKRIGLLAIRVRQRHICFFFVDGEYHRRGIGTKLFRWLRGDFPGQKITLNSSPYGLLFYKTAFAEFLNDANLDSGQMKQLDRIYISSK